MLISQIPYAPASALVAEAVELKKSNAPKSIIEVILYILEERKELISEKIIAMRKLAILDFIPDIRYYEKELALIQSIQKEI